MIYWKIEFDEGLTGQGWVAFNEQMESVGVYDNAGTLITSNVGYHPIEFNLKPDWAE